MVQHHILRYEDYEIKHFTRGKNCELLSYKNFVFQLPKFQTSVIILVKITAGVENLKKQNQYNTAGHEQVMYVHVQLYNGIPF